MGRVRASHVRNNFVIQVKDVSMSDVEDYDRRGTVMEEVTTESYR